MSLTVNTNVSALNAQRNLGISKASLTTSMERLSSGLRINSAKDDSAGLSISERFTAQIRGNDQAGRNANDAISLAQTAEGDLEQIGNSLQRIRELAVQSSNATNNFSDRQAINNEAGQLISEIDRIASGSSFNGTNLLDGSFSAKSFQVGANNTGNDKITIGSIASAKSSALGLSTTSSYSTTITGSAGVTATAFTAGGLTINGYNVGASVSDGVSSTNSTSSGIAKAAAINAVSSQTNVTASVSATAVTGAAALTTAGTYSSITVNGVSIGGVTLAAGDTTASSGEKAAAAINAKTSQTGVTAAFSTSNGALTLTAADGRNISLAEGTAGDLAKFGLTAGTTTSTVTLSSTGSSGITLGGSVTDLGTGFSVGNTAATASTGSVATLNLLSAASSQAALDSLDGAISSINSSRASLGAFQNRFEAAVSNLQTKNENLTASRGRITDADFAKEMANLSRSQVLQQAGTAMLAQANQSAQGVLSLLR